MGIFDTTVKEISKFLGITGAGPALKAASVPITRATDDAGATGTHPGAAINVTTSFTLIVGASGTRRRVSVVNVGTVRIYLGTANTVTASDTGNNFGWIDPGDSWSEEYRGAVYGRCATGSSYASYLEVLP